MSAAGPWVAAGLVLLAALAVLRRPLRRLGGLLLRSLGALGALALFSQVGPHLGIYLGVNLVNALVLGALGAPGFALLLMMQWMLQTA